MLNTYFQGCEYDIIADNAQEWVKTIDGYALSNPKKFYHRVYRNMIDNHPPSFRATKIKLLFAGKRDFTFYHNLYNILDDLIKFIEVNPSVHVMINDFIDKIDYDVFDHISELPTSHIQYGITRNTEYLSHYVLMIEIDLNHYVVMDKKIKRVFHKTVKTFIPQTEWEIHFLNHNHGIRFLDPLSLN